MSSSRIAKGCPMMTLTIRSMVTTHQKQRLRISRPETNLRVPSQFGPQYLYVDMVVQRSKLIPAVIPTKYHIPVNW